MFNFAKRLLAFTEGCRRDMHEPDEQGFERVELVGGHLDNACGDHISLAAISGGYQEYVLIIDRHKADDGTTWREKFNLASIIALARIGAQSLASGAR